MFLKLLLRTLPFTLLILLICSIQNNIYANNTSNTPENNKENKEEISKNEEDDDNIDEDELEYDFDDKENSKNEDEDNNLEEDNNIDEYNFDEENDSSNTEEDDDDIDEFDDEEESIDEDEDSFDDEEESIDEDENSFDDEEDSIDEGEDSFDEDEDSFDDENDDSENEVYDPLEKINRKVFKFNDTMNDVLSKIVPKRKNKSKPSTILKAVGNFSHNFFEIPIGINYALQGNIKNTSNSIARLMINTAFGFFGVTDVAEKLGFKKNNTYFGDTLKKWGMKPGPYVVLPILGPTSLRGAVGQAFGVPISHTAKLPIKNFKSVTKNTIYYAAYCSKLLATRSAYAEMIDQVSAMSSDKYKTFRNITMASESN